MSLIYKSLQRVRNDAAAPPVAVNKRAQRKRAYSTGVSKRLGVFLVLFAMFSLLGFFFFTWVEKEIERLAPRVDDKRTAMEQVLEQQPDRQANATEDTLEQTTKINVARVLAEAGKKVQKSLPPLSKPRKVNLDTRKKVGMEDLVKPTTELEKHFATKARRNQAILSLEQRLVEHWRQGDAEGTAVVLHELEQKAGPESALVRKWQGTMALKDKRYREAERLFRSILRSGGDQPGVRINLIQALVGQGKSAEMEQELRRLKIDFPVNDKVARFVSRIRQQ